MNKLLEKPSEQSNFHSLIRDALKIIGYFVVLLCSILLSKWILGDNWKEIFEAVGLAFVMFFLAYCAIIIHIRLFIKHPVELQFNKSQELFNESEKNIKNAKDLFQPHALIKQGVIAIGYNDSSYPDDKELVQKVFQNSGKVQPIEINFMGTAYGAFSLDEKNVSYGFLHALKEHISKCRTAGINHPFKNIRLVCGNHPLYSLSAKYLCLQIFNEINIHSKMSLSQIKVAYPHEECIPATLIIEGLSDGDRVLIAPSIGKEDKEFLGEYYPIGIIIKDVTSLSNGEDVGNWSCSASNTIERLKKQFDSYMNNTPEIWRYDRINGITISNLHKFDYIDSLNTLPDNEIKTQYLDQFMNAKNNISASSSSNTIIPESDIQNVSILIASSIKVVEKLLHSKS